MTAHTPGPWYAEALTGVILDSRGAPIVTGGNPSVGAGSDPVGFANAVLIAAAPEMLEVLRALVDDCTAGMGTMSPRGFVLDDARAAIAKATGADAHAGTDARCGWCPDCVQGKPCPCAGKGTP